MDKQEKITFIEEKADGYIQLGELLRKSRPPEIVQKVNTIANSQKTLEEKVKLIKDIDNEYEFSINKSKVEEHKELTIKEAAQNRKNIKLFYKRNKFFNYLFFHWSKIRKYGKRVHTISTGLWPFTLQLDERFKAFYKDTIKGKYADFLYIKLELLLNTGWKLLIKQEYNLLVLFLRLLKKIKDISLEEINLTDRSLLHKIYGMEVFFLSLHYKDNYLNIILSGISRLMSADQDYREHIETAVKYTKCILKPNATLPSLYHFILSLNMVNSRFFLSFRKLINRDNSGILCAGNFDCNREITTQIKSYINTIEDSLKRLLEHKYEIVQLKQNLPTKTGSEVDFSNLKSFYNFFNLHQQDYKFEKDKENTILFAQRFLNKFLCSFKNILNEQINLKDNNKVSIFDRNFFDADFNRMQLVHDKIANLLIKLPFFTRKRYLKIKSAGEGGIAIEIEAIQLINEALDIIWRIGKKVSTIIRRREKSLFDNIGEIPEIGFEEPIDFQTLKKPSITIPYGNKYIDTDDLFYGKTIIDSLVYISSVCYVSSFFFYNESVHTLLKEENNINNKIAEQMELLQRIADNETYTQFKNKIDSILKE